MPKKRVSKIKEEPEDDYLSDRDLARRFDKMAAPMPATLPLPTGATRPKLPAFWESTPEAWFVHAEAEFAVHGIVDDHLRYHLVVAALPASTAARLVGLLKCPPPTNRYSTIRQRLLYAFGPSEEERADQLLAIDGLGGRRPSELMDHMLDLLGEHTPGLLFTRLFMRALPGHVRSTLAGFPTSDLCALAREADKVFMAAQQPAPPRRTMASAAGSERAPTPAPVNPAATRRQDGYCRLHSKFGRLARRCIQPCSFPAEGNETAGVRL